MSWRDYFDSRTAEASQVIKNIRDGDSVVTAFGCCEPKAITRAMYENYEMFHDVKIACMIILGKSLWTEEKMKGHFLLNSFFAGASNRNAISNGDADYTTCYFHEIPEVLRTVVKPRVTMMSVCPPDENGYVSLGTNVDYISSTLDYCEVKIAQVNKFVPRTHGKAIRHVSEFDWFVKADEPLPEVTSVPVTEVERQIGKNCASLINDGDCIQLGIGGIPNAICGELGHKKHLGLHSEMVGDGIIDLIKNGVIDNSMKNTKHKGKCVLGFVFGTKKLFDFMNDNPNIEMHPISYVNYPAVIAENDNTVSVNSCLQIDLQGQVVADTIGLMQFSGVGGQVDFVRGAAMSRGGKSIIAMPSTAKNGTVSRIVPTITENSAVTTTRNDVQYIVTEYGIADLKGKTMRERARALIKIAHPDFYGSLCDVYEKRFGEKPF